MCLHKQSRIHNYVADHPASRAQLKGPIAIAAIVGRYRTGKSLLVNRMLLDLAGNGFQVGSTVNSCTKGLWLWDKPLRCKNAEGQVNHLLERSGEMADADMPYYADRR